MSVIVDGTSGLTFNDSSLQGAAASPYVLKNRIINGAMMIDQRNAGASVTITTSNPYTLDRWRAIASQSSKFTVQQNAGSVTPPTGYTNYIGITSSSAYSVVSGDYFSVTQYIEGYNMADFGWGASGAATITLSFWVRSSLTGTFGGALSNSAETYTYPFSYTISSANTWEQKSVTIAGPTSGTWVTNNGRGIELTFGLGAGSTYSGTANTWQSNWFNQPTSTTSVVGTNGATFYITGVQLEIGTSATPFERRLYNQELANCYRYYYLPPVGQMGAYATASQLTVAYSFPITMRATPTISGTSATFGFTKPWILGGLTGQFDSNEQASTNYASINYSSLSSTGSIGNPIVVNTNDVQFSAEL